MNLNIEDVKAWMHANVATSTRYIEAAGGPEALDHVARVVTRAVEVQAYQASRIAEEKALEVARDMRSKAQAYEAGFKEGSADLAYSRALVAELDGRVESIAYSSAQLSINRAAAVFKVLAGDDPRLNLAINLLTTSGMSAEAIVSAVETIPETKSKGNEWQDFMSKHHNRGAEADGMEVDDEPGATSMAKPTEKNKAKFLASIGHVPGEKVRSPLASGGMVPRIG